MSTGILAGLSEQQADAPLSADLVRRVQMFEEPGSLGAEMPLGEGAVGIDRFVAKLQSIGYTGPLTIEREIAQEPERQKAEIGQAVRLLNELKAKIG